MEHVYFVQRRLRQRATPDFIEQKTQRQVSSTCYDNLNVTVVGRVTGKLLLGTASMFYWCWQSYIF
jgi:hypothetical protein